MFWGLNAGATPLRTRRHSSEPVLAVSREASPRPLVTCTDTTIIARSLLTCVSMLASMQA
jgi:hypothetical protein